MINVLVCDDSKEFAEELGRYIEKWSGERKVKLALYVHSTPEKVIAEDKKYNLAFVDIEMPGVDGIELSKSLYKRNGKILITVITSFQKYLDDAMRIRVFRYLSKPLDEKRLWRCLDDALAEYGALSDSFAIKSGGNIVRIFTSDILYIENMKHGSIVFTKTDKIKTSEKPAEVLSRMKNPEAFVVSHLGITVNLENVVGFSKEEIRFKCGDGSVIGIPYISQRRYKAFKQAFLEYAGGAL